MKFISYKYLFASIVTIVAFSNLFGKSVSGYVVQSDNSPIIGANVFWLNTTKGAVTDLDGLFTIPTTRESKQLVISYVSCESDTITIHNASDTLRVTLTETKRLDEVEVTARAAATVASRISPIQTQTINYAELCKAACCNLSESFETNASVDVAYSDAATGAKQIRLLGLSGTYVQLLTENTPSLRGLASTYGLEYIPGPWMENIQVSKGTSSVTNGYEATTGQINVEFLKPQKADPLSLNLFVSSALRTEFNATSGLVINDKLSTGILAHYKNESFSHDGNGDTFVDIPLSNSINLMNRWYYKNGDYIGQVMVRGLYDQRRGGQSAKHNTIENPYLINTTTARGDFFVKNGYILNREHDESVGVILSGSYHNQNSQYGARTWFGEQTNLYLNAIYQRNFGHDHKLVTGASVNFDDYNEFLRLSNTSDKMNFDRTEYVPGLFAEYTYNFNDKVVLLAGVRADYSNRFGFFVTPRLNIKYSPWEFMTVRGSVGKGYRTPNAIADNSFMLPSSRKLIFAEPLKQENAWNMGASVMFNIPMFGRELQLTGEYYFTNFVEGTVVDMDSDPHAITLSNLNGGRSYAGNFQVEASYEIFKGWTMTLAHRMTDVKTTINGELKEKPLTNRYKSLLTTSYQTPLKRWQFDFTAQLNGGGRLPNAATENPLWQNEFKAYPILMAQVTKYFRTWSMYLGCENITNFVQSNPIIDAQNPFGENFDASMAWGPIHGRKFYIGFRWALEKK